MRSSSGLGRPSFLGPGLALTFVALFATLSFESAAAQSLGEVAKRERERREKNKAEGVEVQAFTEQEVFGPDDEAVSSEGDPEAEAEAIDRAFEGPEFGGEDDYERESRERRRSEAEWRGRIQQARDRLAAAQERRRWLDGLNLSVGESYVDAHGRTVISSLEHLRRLVREADEAVARAEAELEDLREEARRAGVPPGWLR